MPNAKRGLDKMKNIIFIAPPIAGKGTISDYLVKNYHYEHISTGDLLRDEIASGSEFGQKLDIILKSGSLVDDETVIQLVRQKITTLAHQAFILDGFPRTLKQAKALDQLLDELHIGNNVAIYLNVDLDTALKRVMARVICPKCKRSYNLNNEKLKPVHKDICDDCGEVLIHRSDDNEETFRVRYDSFMNNTKPILDFYQDKGILCEIDATMPLEEIYEQLEDEAEIRVKGGCSND